MAAEAPEICQNVPYGGSDEALRHISLHMWQGSRIDIWSLGTVLYELLSLKSGALPRGQDEPSKAPFPEQQHGCHGVEDHLLRAGGVAVALW